MKIDIKTIRELDAMLNEYILYKTEEQEGLGQKDYKIIDKAIRIRILLNKNM